MDRVWDRVPAAAAVLALGAAWVVPFAAWMTLDHFRLVPAAGSAVLIVLWFVTGFPAIGLGGILILANWGKPADEFPTRWLAYVGALLGGSGPMHLTLVWFGVLR